MAFGHDDAVLVDRVSRVRRGHDVAGADGGEEEMREGVFRADGDDSLFFGIQIDVVVTLVAGADGFAQIGDAARERIAVIARIARRFDKLVYDDFGSLAVGVTHTEVDDIHLGCPCLCAHFVEDGKDVGGQLLDATAQ